jgi:hypothetical protein
MRTVRVLPPVLCAMTISMGEPAGPRMSLSTASALLPAACQQTIDRHVPISTLGHEQDRQSEPTQGLGEK